MKHAVEAPDARTQLASIVFAVILLDPAGTVREANPAAEEMLGSSAVRLVGRSFFGIVAIGDRRVADALRDSDGQMIARGLAIEVARRERRANLTCSPVAGNAGWRIVTLSDAGQEDEDRDAERPELRAPTVLAHEIKNPLAAIRGASQLLTRRASERDKPLTQLIATEVDRIAELVDRMQQLGSAASVVSSPCNLHEAIRNAIGTVRTSRGGEFETIEEFDPSLPLVLADRAALEQILINLIANACDAIERVADPKVVVRTRFTGGLVFNAVRLGEAADRGQRHRQRPRDRSALARSCLRTLRLEQAARAGARPRAGAQAGARHGRADRPRARRPGGADAVSYQPAGGSQG